MARETPNRARTGRRSMAIAAILATTAAVPSLAAGAPAAQAGTAKTPISGVVDRMGRPATGWESVVNNYVVRVKWSELQPDYQGETLSPNNAIDQAIANVQAWNASHTPPESIKLRIDAGTGAPGWAKNLDGSGTAVAVHDASDPNNPDTTPDTVGRFWEPAFGTAYNDLQSKLATKYDGVPEVRDVTISRCTLSTVEPFLRTASSQNTINHLNAAGYSLTADDACQHAEIDEAKAVWLSTPSSLALNPYQQINADGSNSLNESYTESMISYCRTTLGSLCVLENNSLRDPLQTGPRGEYTSMYSAMKNAGSPISFQTAGNSSIGSLCNTLTSAVRLGANSVELPGGYWNNADTTQAGLSSYDKALGHVQPADTTAPSAPNNLKATVNSSSSVTLNWDAATDAGYGVACYSVARNGTPIGTTMATRFVDTAANTLTPTQYTVTANDGAGNVGPAAAVSITPPTTAVSASSSTITYGSTVTFTATVTSQDGGTPTGTVKFYDGSSQLGTGTLSNGQAQLSTSSLSAGSHTISATYQGDATFPPSDPSPGITETVNKAASTTALTNSPNPSGFGSPVTLTATVTGPGSTPTGTVTFKDGSTPIGSPVSLDSNGQATVTTSSLAMGNHTLGAAYGGDGNYNASSGTHSQTVTKASTATALTSSANPATYGSPVTFTATVTSPGGTPSGSVTFKNGSTSLGTVTLDGTGTAQLPPKTLTNVTNSITAVYAGNTNFAASTSPVVTQTQNNAPATVALSTSSSAVTAPSSVTLTASVTSTAGTPTGTVTFHDVSTSQDLGTATIASGKATLTIALPAGGHVITAAYSGDASFSPKTSGALFQKVNHTGGKTSSTSVATSFNPSTSGQPVTITATVTAGATGTVWFFDGGNVIGQATVDGAGHATFTTSALSVGSHSLKAGYSGDGSFNPSLSNAKTQTVNP